MALTQALSIYQNAEDKANLRNIIVGILENIGKATVSGRLKSRNADLSKEAGSYEFKRFANAVSKEYGTARTTGKGEKVIAPSIPVNLDQNREIVEEVNEFDANSFTEEKLEAFLTRRQKAIQLAIERELDKAFFEAIKTQGTAAGIAIDSTGNIVEQLEEVILKLVTTKNEFVDGVDRENMALILSPKLYSKLKTELNDVYNFSGTVEEGTFKGINGVAAFEALRLPEGVDYALVTMDSVAQPVLMKDAVVGVWPGSIDVFFGSFFRYGTKVLAKELVLYGAMSA